MGSVARLIMSLLLILVLGSVAGGIIYGVKEYIAKCDSEKKEAQLEAARREQEAREERLQMARMREEAIAKAKREEADKAAERLRLAQEAEARRITLLAEERAAKAAADKKAKEDAERRSREEKEVRERIRLAQEQAAEAEKQKKAEDNAFEMLKAAIQFLAPKNQTRAEWSKETAQALLAEAKKPREKVNNPSIPKAVSLLRDPDKISALRVLCAESQRKNEQIVTESNTKTDGGKLRIKSCLDSINRIHNQVLNAEREEQTGYGITINNATKIRALLKEQDKLWHESQSFCDDVFFARRQIEASQSVLDTISVIRDMLGQQGADIRDEQPKVAKKGRTMFLKDGTKIAVRAIMEADGAYTVINPSGDRRVVLKTEVDRISEE